MIQLTIQDFTKQELIKNIVQWMRESNIRYSNMITAANTLESGEWLQYFNDIINNNNKVGNK